MTVRTIKGPEDFAAAFTVSPETIDRLATYEKLLKQWQKAVNLVAPGTLPDVWHRHFADSAQLVPLAPPGVRSWIDLGSGAGFPGLVCAIVLADRLSPSPRRRGEGRGEGQPQMPTSEQAAAPHPNPLPMEEGGEGINFTLVESDTRKAAFLREVARSVGPLGGITLEILPARAESVRTQVNLVLPRVVSARALAPLEKLLALASPLSPPGTTALFCKGKEADREIEAARRTWNFDVDLVPSVTDERGRIAVITKLEPRIKD